MLGDFVGGSPRSLLAVEYGPRHVGVLDRRNVLGVRTVGDGVRELPSRRGSLLVILGEDAAMVLLVGR